MSIGPIIDESLDNKFVHITTSAKARQVLLVKWIVLGFCLTACYKSVLLSEMVNIGYEKTIDSVEDALVSGKLFVVPENTDVPSKIRNGIGNVKKLANQMKLANMSFDSSKQFPQWVYDGSVSQYMSIMSILYCCFLFILMVEHTFVYSRIAFSKLN